MSPWLYQLVHKRPIDTLHDDIKTDIAIVGAGIAGVMTAYFVLKHTDKQVVLIEGNKVAHGATGRNAGQLVAEFERELHDIASEFGVTDAVQAEMHVNSSWILIEELFQEAKLTTPFSTFMGYNGYTSADRILDEIKNNAVRIEAGEAPHKFFIADTAVEIISGIPDIYRDLYSVIPHADVLDLLETDNPIYVAAMSLRKGCINGALLCEELVGYLLATYPLRFTLAEHAEIQQVELFENYVVLTHKKTADEIFSIEAEKVVLCTNGFSKFSIKNSVGADIDTHFHHNLHGFMGYMAGYLEELNRQPNALAYYGARKNKKHHRAKPGELPEQGDYYDDPYFYLTRRPYEIEKNESHNLVCIGGPEVYLKDTSVYDPHAEYDEKMALMMDSFLKKNYRHTPKDNMHFKFTWHGLMGFTSNGIRLIGAEPLNPVLMYNLGCNGVGILPGIYGAKRIADIIAGVTLEPTIFDPRHCGVDQKTC